MYRSSNAIISLPRQLHFKSRLIGISRKSPGKDDDDDDDDTLRLIDPEGVLFSNTVISSIFAELP